MTGGGARDAAAILAEVPESPGVYIYRDPRGKPIYVGKAKNLRRRVSQYFHRPDLDPKTRRLMATFATIETVVTGNELEALSLENTLIKKHRPRFNILLRDDKTWPYIKVTTGEAWPRALVTRRVQDDGHTYFGPYIPGGQARRLMQMLTRYLRIRTCSLEIDGKLPRPCLYYDLQACPGPCVAGLTTAERYADAVEEAILFLRGRTGELSKRLSAEMDEAAAREDFERAAHLRDLIRALAASERLVTENTSGDDLDAFGFHEESGDVTLCVLVMRGGRVVDRRQVHWEKVAEPGAFEAPAFFAAILPQYYAAAGAVPAQVHLPVPLPAAERELLGEWLAARAGRKVELRVPERGDGRRRVDLAEENARLSHAIRFKGAAEAGEPLARLARALSLPAPPARIEGFDISHLQGKQVYASLVVFDGGRPNRSEYRLFAISGAANDDFASLAEAVGRRYARRLEEGGELPGLVLIDGGRGQLGAARGALEALGLEIPLASLAKKDEEVWLPERYRPLRLARRDPALRLLQQVRDEAHRFALTAHRRRRGKEALASALDGIPGLGPAGIRLLLREFGDPRSAALAPAERLAALLGAKRAAAIGPLLRARFPGDDGGASAAPVDPESASIL